MDERYKAATATGGAPNELQKLSNTSSCRHERAPILPVAVDLVRLVQMTHVKPQANRTFSDAGEHVAERKDAGGVRWRAPWSVDGATRTE